MSLEQALKSINNLDPYNICSWPIVVRIVMWLGISVVAGFLIYQMMLAKSLDELNGHQKKETELVDVFEQRAFKAANLGLLKKQMVEMKESFEALAKQLPDDTEVPGLLEELSQLGIDSGLEFDSIGLGNEKEEEFYYELPIQISVTGTFHALGAFVSGISSLPRIVTLHDFTIMPIKSEAGGSSGLLTMSITAKTYRYNEEEV
ncbi:MAG: type 4a pilus biogenesis protein PilO [Gammaproteobacteria bacterium]